ncbi:serine/threonine-protein phosphatase 4 regulatory subunit 1 isoform X2 [Tribolium castaneum]|uniref:serine/threonine-protein phosphatase 4 regulatory subunit 1 isoform X2 n=1 Tax=Tribolium castaneum TaxID=7070 RepID=UPI00077DA021|nr:PREDICTED: serine/threonine-protein phosphatase 4 regulatory subunit 1 isoform X2 [Tribolium castaneum]|eukprot:XP_015832998.1 PREDICTED: serine/threonine-protein phosphatase 4 regulatory subunit 1 isoform X2 [Tribolium castaneum]
MHFCRRLIRVFEQGDCSTDSSGDDELLPPLSRVQKYAQAGNIYDRKMVARIVQDLFRTSPPEILAEELPSIMTIVRSLGEKDETMVRADLLDQVPHIASQALKYSNRVEALKNVTGDYLIPLVVRNLGSSENAVDKAAHTTLIHLLEQGLITKQQAEIQVCPAILALSHEEQIAEINTGAITLMSRMAPLLGRDVTERVFLKRFSEMCESSMFYTRKMCAAHIGDFAVVVGKQPFHRTLLPCYIALCEDSIWGVRKSCAEVIMFISTVSAPEVRRRVLAPVFARLLQDDCRWVQMSAFQALGPFIITYANPPLTSTAYNSQGELIFVNKDGQEFLMNVAKETNDVRFKYLPRQPSPLSSDLSQSCSEVGIGDWQGVEDVLQEKDDECASSELESERLPEENFDLDSGSLIAQSDEDIKEIVETVKNAVLSYRNVEQEHGVIGDNLKTNLSNANVISNLKNASCDKLGSELDAEFANLSLSIDEPSTSKMCDDVADDGAETTVEQNQVILNSESEKEDDNLHLYNSYNYWYIRPEMPLDLSLIEEIQIDRGKVDDTTAGDTFAEINLNENLAESNKNDAPTDTASESKEVAKTEPVQDIVPQVLISHYFLMTDSSFSSNIDNEMSYHCAYSLPAIALTLENKNWPLLKRTIELLASDMHYKVRRTVASSLHELAFILGQDIASEHLTPIFEGFIKDLDEVRIGILRNLAYFLKIIKPAKRLACLPRLQEFLKTETEWNWRFRHELAKQLLSIVTLFKPVDSAKHIGVIGEVLLFDVSAVRQIAISLITELLRHISSKPDLSSLYLVRLVEKFAHSKKWKRRQTFALLCYKLLSAKALPAEKFATEIMPHLLDLSWDPVANVRLVVAKTIAQHVIPNEYFADPSNQHFDSLGTVIRRLQADKDRDVRQYAEISDKFESVSPTLSLDYID